MGDEQQRARVAAEPVLEPQHRVEVEVVGRLVEQQQVRAAHQRLREVEAHPPAAGEARHRIARAARRRSPARRAASRRARAPRSRRSPRSGGAARRAPRRRVRVGVVRGFGRGERALDARSSASPSSTKSIAGASTGGRLLRDVGDRPRGGSSTLPGVGRRARRAAARTGSTCRSRWRRRGRPCGRRGRSATRPRAGACAPRASVRLVMRSTGRSGVATPYAARSRSR